MNFPEEKKIFKWCDETDFLDKLIGDFDSDTFQ
jgi:hypothetical protein